jgi:RNA polymerase-binding transcription factor DksA
VGEAKKVSHEFAGVQKELLKRKLELEDEMRALNSQKFSDDQVQDVGDQALTSTMDSLTSSLQNTKIDEYKRIIRALEMIEEGTYGICVDCHNPISEKRLKSFPNATRCLLCQEAYEDGMPAHIPESEI